MLVYFAGKIIRREGRNFDGDVAGESSDGREPILLPFCDPFIISKDWYRFQNFVFVVQ